MKNTNMKLRFAALILIVIAGFTAMFLKLANLQLRNYEIYGQKAASSMTKTFTLKGVRGQIQDVDGNVLAYNKGIYNIQFYREPSQKKAPLTVSAYEVMKIVSYSEKSTITDFWMRKLETGDWVYDVGMGTHMGEDGVWRFNSVQKPDGNGKIATEPSAETIRICSERVAMLRSNFYASNPKYDKPNDFVAYLMREYGVDALEEKLAAEGDGETLDDATRVKLLAIWQAMQMNAYSSRPVTIAQDVPWATAMEIEMRQIVLPGISVDIGSQRVYPQGALACHILGYIGPIPANWWSASRTEYLASGYAMNDWIGLDGVERSMEEYLTGATLQKQGSKVVEVDYEGKIMKELSQTPAQNGSTVRLTIRSDLQKVAEEQLASVITSIRNTQENTIKDPKWLEANADAIKDRNFETYPLNLAQNGAVVVLDMQARVLAMASAPNFDPNLFITGMNEEQRERVLVDPRHPLFNNAIGSRDTPGSIFKLTTSLAALTNGAITPTTEISDRSPFKAFDSVSPPSCWANASTRARDHQHQTIIEGLMHSCNYFFFSLFDPLANDPAALQSPEASVRERYRGLSPLSSDGEQLYQMAVKLGLTSKTNVDLPGEMRSIVGNQRMLYDPTKPLTEYDQETAVPVIVKAQLKKHLKAVGERYSYTYSEERLDKCIKALMDMAVAKNQNDWVSEIRIILMRELGMPREVVILAATVNDIYSYLNDIKWGGSLTIQTAIGQSITLLTPIAVARYVVAVANGGYVYNASIVDAIISPDGTVRNLPSSMTLVNDLSAEVAQYIPYVKEGMKGVVEGDGTAEKYFKDWKYIDQIAGKTGTAEKSRLDVENNAWFIAFAPYDNPEIAVVVYVPNGMAAGYVTPVAKAVIEKYLDTRQELPEEVIPAPNSLAP
ncbi:MAG: hypothetical protein LBD16_03535 [Oscillospiraceae bacterium]|jgi:penicillin-binding protein 2|nr:hypothetical protein [Oscillospiraceae bacterium]